MNETSESNASPQRNPRGWFKYFVEPMGWAKTYTTNSRNVLNIGLAALILAFVLFGESLSRVAYAFQVLPNDYLVRLEQVDGVYAAIGGGKASTPKVCIANQQTEAQLACTFLASWFSRRTPEFIGREATAWIDESSSVGVVRLVVGGEEILNPHVIQQHLQDSIRKFLCLVGVFIVCLLIAIYRQRSLVSKRNSGSSA